MSNTKTNKGERTMKTDLVGARVQKIFREGKKAGREEGRREILEKLENWIQGLPPLNRRSDIFHDCVLDFIDDNTPPEV